MPLAGEWLFKFDRRDQGIDREWFNPETDRKDWEKVTVPGVWNHAPGKISNKPEIGIGWYAKEIKVPDDWSGDMAFCFLGVMFIADIWLDGEYLGTHRGGYTPFMISAENIRPVKKSTLVVRVDNRLNNKTIPKNNTGWQIYGGITREVYLLCRPPVRPENLKISSSVSTKNAVELNISGDLLNDSGKKYENSLNFNLKAGNKSLFTDSVPVKVDKDKTKKFTVSILLDKPRLWSIDDPFLHELEITWGGKNGGKINMPVAIREIRIDGDSLLLNNKRLWLQGFGQHEDLENYGPVIPFEYRKKEMELLKNEYKINHLRSGHYPNHPALYQLCDQLGILAFTEIPCWQLDRTWVQTDSAWENWIEPQLREMITFYRNFGSIVSWGISNEMGGAADFEKKGLDYIRKNDPDRLPMFVQASTSYMKQYEMIPMVGRNYHYGWYHSKRVYDGLRNGYKKNLQQARQKDIPIWVAELGGQAAKGRLNGSYNDHSRGSETYLDKIVRFGFQYCAVTDERISGVAIWTWSDFVRHFRKHYHGITSLNRSPKLVAYTVRNLFEGKIRLYLCENDTTCYRGGKFIVEPFIFRPDWLQDKPRKGLKVRWQIIQGKTILKSGEIPVKLIEKRSTPLPKIEWDIPQTANGFYSLWAELLDEKGNLLYTNAVHFGVNQAERPGILEFHVKKGDINIPAIAELNGVRLPVYRHPGLIIPLKAGSYSLKLTEMQNTKPINFKILSGKYTSLIFNTETSEIEDKEPESK